MQESEAIPTRGAAPPRASIDEHIAKAAAHRQRGNELVASQDWKRAAFEYKHVPLFLGQYLPGARDKADPMVALASGRAGGSAPQPTPEQDAAIRTALIAAQCNQALVQLKLGRPSNALAASQAALDLAPSSPKALYRRAQARLALGLVEEAGADFEAALRLSPGDQAVLAGLAEVKAATERARHAEAKMCARMFA
jgi:tetratricopeptide (TPR) repeat protein